MNYSVGKKLAHLVNGLKFKVDEIEEIRKLYSGEPFNPNDEGIKKLIETSRALCEKFSSLGAKRHRTRFGYHIKVVKFHIRYQSFIERQPEPISEGAQAEHEG